MVAEHLRSRGVTLEIIDDSECVKMMQDFTHKSPELWIEDIGQ